MNAHMISLVGNCAALLVLVLAVPLISITTFMISTINGDAESGDRALTNQEEARVAELDRRRLIAVRAVMLAVAITLVNLLINLLGP